MCAQTGPNGGDLICTQAPGHPYGCTFSATGGGIDAEPMEDDA